jgi:CheY-like chemotaxis protein
VKELVEIQGGKVAVQSKQGVGTTFTVHLPFLRPEPVHGEGTEAPDDNIPPHSKAALINADGTVSNEEWLANLYRRAELFPSVALAQTVAKPGETTLNGDGPRILIADDEPDMLRFLKSQLASHFQIIEATDGQQAVDKASQHRPDIVLLDMMMPRRMVYRCVANCVDSPRPKTCRLFS